MYAVHHFNHCRFGNKYQTIQIQGRLGIGIHHRFLGGIIVTYIINGNAFIPEFSERKVRYPEGMQIADVGKYADLSGILTGDHKAVFPIRGLLVPFIGSHIHHFGIAEAIH